MLSLVQVSSPTLYANARQGIQVLEAPENRDSLLVQTITIAQAHVSTSPSGPSFADPEKEKEKEKKEREEKKRKNAEKEGKTPNASEDFEYSTEETQSQ